MKKLVTILMLLLLNVFAVQNIFATTLTSATVITFKWDDYVSDKIKGYKVYYATTPQSYTESQSIYVSRDVACINSICSITIDNLAFDQTWSFAVKAVDINNKESIEYSNSIIEYVQDPYFIVARSAEQHVNAEAGLYNMLVKSDGMASLSFVGNSAPTITIVLDKTEYIEGDFATIIPKGIDAEGASLNYTCYHDDNEFSGLTTENLPVGQHNVYCKVSDGVNVVSSDSIQVTVLDGPHITLPENLTLTAAVGDNLVSGDLSISNSGYGILSWSINTTSGMLSFSQTSGQTSGSNSSNLTVIADTSDLDEGVYYGDVVITSQDANNSPKTVSVEVHVVYLTNNTASRDLEASSHQYLYIADSSQSGLDLGINGMDFTLEAWIKLEEAVSGYNSSLMAKRGGPDQRGMNWGLVPTSGGNDRVYFGVTSSRFVNETVKYLDIGHKLLANTWYHLAVSYHGASGSAEIFVNGSSIGSVTGLPTSVANNSANLTPLAEVNNDAYFDGKVDEYRIWNIARTETEIASDYDHELIGNEAGLAAYWKFNNDVLDATSNNNDLMNSGSAVYSTDTPTEH